jgi:UDP-N-acetyl-D-mannosaminuronic acid dehydrogenase
MTKSNFETISVVGLGYIGLPTAAMFAARKIRVIGVDINQRAVDTINRGEIHIVEPDLDMAVQSSVHSGYLRATTSPEPAEAFLIAVPTPFKGDNHEPDLSFIEVACNRIALVLKPGDLVILESTSPVGATERMAEWLALARPDLSFPQTAGELSDIRVAYCPERVLPGKIMQELISNDRIIGGMTPRCSELATKLYKTFVTGECIIASSPRVAELAKLTENSFRDVNIAFANELSIICDKLNMNVWELIQLANRHPRVNILQPGPGVGGHCIAVDPWFIVSSAPTETQLIQTARQINDKKPLWAIDQVKYLAHKNPNSRIVCLGLAFKPNIDDLRESPSLAICEELFKLYGERVHAVEPNTVETFPFKLLLAGEINNDEDIVVCLVHHEEFKALKKPALYLDFIGLFDGN